MLLRFESHSLGFNTDAIVYGSANPLFTAEITFGCLHGYMSKQELDLVQLAPGSQLGTKQASIGRFIGETPNRGESSIDRSRSQSPSLKMDTVTGDHCL